MTRIAILADVHGNLPALEAVLDDIARQGVDEVLHAGDLIGRGPQGSAVVACVRAAGIRGARGNHEDLLLQVRAGELLRGIVTSTSDRICAPCVRWMAEELDAEASDFAHGLPFEIRSGSDASVMVVHGSPRSNREGIGPWTADANLGEILEGIEASVVVCAHTHRPMVRTSDDRLVVNTGSVGLSFDGDPRASYAMLERSRGQWTAEIRRLEYDRETFLEIYRTSGFLDAGGTMARALEHEIVTGRSHLVPYITWAGFESRDPDGLAFDEFTSFYDPNWGLRGMRLRLGEVAPA